MVPVQTNPYQMTPGMNQPDPTDVIGSRIGAWLIDAAIGTVVLVVAFTTILDKLTLSNSQAATNLCDTVNNSPGNTACFSVGSTVYGGTGSDMAEIALVMLAFFVAFHVILPTLTGYSPGKGIVGLRVVNQETFRTAGIGANSVRWILWIVDAAPYFVPLVGFITGLASKGHRRVGDMAASTVVVRKRSVGSPVPIPGVNSATVGGTAAMASNPPPPPTNWSPPAPAMQPTPAPSSGPPMAAAPPVSPPTPTEPTPPPFAPPASTEPTPVADAGPEKFPPETTPETTPEPEPDQPSTDAQDGVGTPQWDTARNTYIQWDPELREWMEWNEGQGRWIPISQ